MGIVFFLLIYLLGHVFLSVQLAKILSLQTVRKKIVFYSFYFLVASSYLWSRNLPKVLAGSVGDTIALIGGFVIANTYYTVLILTMYGIAKLLYKYAFRGQKSLTGKQVLMTLLSLLFMINIYGVYNAQQQVQTNYVLKTEKNIKVSELKIIMLSDLHLGKTTEQSFALELVEKINLLQPDLVLLVGDIIDSDLESVERKEQLAPFKNIKARFGIYGVMGNHEYLSGVSKKAIELLQANNIWMLVDETVRVSDAGIVLTGLDDESRAKLQSASSLVTLENLNIGDYNIILDHQPKRIMKISENQAVDLILSGHTHRGQYFPNNYITEKMYVNDWGLKKIANLTSIVSSGYGNWSAPMRLGSHTELVVITLKKN